MGVKEGRVMTSINLDSKTFQMLKILRVKQNISLGKIVEMCILKELSKKKYQGILEKFEQNIKI